MKGRNNPDRILFRSPTVQAGWEKESVLTDFENLKNLGSGSFGTVRQVRHKKSHKIYALKEIKKSTLNSRKLIEQAKTQIKIMYSLNHPHIIKLYNHFEDEISIFLVLEFASQGELFEILRTAETGKFPEKTAAEYIRQISSGISELHHKKIMHRDIKLQNILVSKNKEIKIADFGWSHFQTIEERTTFCGTLDYLAPEMLKEGHKHDYRVDLWSLGVLIYELCTGESPFSCELIKKKMLTEDNVKRNIKQIRYVLPEYLSVECKDLITKLLVVEPHMRLQAAEILEHPWILLNTRQEIEKAQSNKWLKVLQDEVRSIFPEETIQHEGSQEFTEEQIYQFSRPDSVINMKFQKLPKKITEQQNSEYLAKPCPPMASTQIVNNDKQTYSKKMAQLQLRVAELQLRHEKDQQEISKLRSEKSNNHTSCQARINELLEHITLQSEQLAIFNHKLAQSQSRQRTFEANKK